MSGAGRVLKIPDSQTSPKIIGPGDARWDTSYEFDDDSKWDSAIRGRPTPVPAGKTVRILHSMLRKKKDDPVQRTVRLTVRALNHPLLFLVQSVLDSEQINFEIPVPANGSQSVSFACDLFDLIAHHPDAAGPDAVAHYRVDDRDAAASFWSDTTLVVGTGAETVVDVPPFAQSFDVYSSAVAAGTLRFYTGIVPLAAVRYFQRVLTLPNDGPFRCPTDGIVTWQAALGSRTGFMFQCVG